MNLQHTTLWGDKTQLELMGHCLPKLLTSAENKENKLLTSSEYEEYNRTTAFVVPISETSRNAASTSALVITYSYSKFSATVVGENKNYSTLSQCYGEDDFSHPMRTGFQYDCKLFA